LSKWQEKIFLLEWCWAIIKSCRADFSSNRNSSRWLWPLQSHPKAIVVWNKGEQIKIRFLWTILQCYPKCIVVWYKDDKIKIHFLRCHPKCIVVSSLNEAQLQLVDESSEDEILQKYLLSYSTSPCNKTNVVAIGSSMDFKWIFSLLYL
jgi:hypothetical protein